MGAKDGFEPPSRHFSRTISNFLITKGLPVEAVLRFVDDILDLPLPDNSCAVLNSDSTELKYGQLRHFSLRLSRHLISLGIRKGDRVAICLDKSLAYVVSLFAVMRAGGICVPLDLGLPPERLGLIIGSFAPRIVIASEAWKDRDLFGSLDAPIFVFAESILATHPFPSEMEGEYPGDRLERSPTDLAYLIFTSGSTGLPKGVMIRHDSIVALVLSVVEHVGYSQSTRYLSVCPFHFDASLTDLYCTLSVGGTLVLGGKLVLPSDLPRSLERHRITDTLLPSTMMKLLSSRFSNLDRFDLGNLRSLWYGGESCPTEVIRRIKELLPQIWFVHGYGPTEATHTSTWFIFDSVPSDAGKYLPIGKPLPNVKVFALTADNRPIVEGEAGELYIQGIQIMDGYWGNPEKTEEVLVPNPLGEEGRAYRTGDFVTIDSHGNYHFIERRDDLIKTNGHLVHLSEVAKCLLQYEEVADAHVTSVPDEILGKKIIAFIFHEAASVGNPHGIKDFLMKKLPRYMLPHEYHFVSCEEIPKNSNGKLDRGKLLEKIQSTTAKEAA
jgi:amino acid adenylation domain-containing protein